MMAQFPTTMNGGPNMWAITAEERGKHDKQFDSLKPFGGYITGDQARSFFLQSGLPAPVLAEIWTLSDLNKDGKMDQLEFSIAMKLIKLKLQGQPLPVVLPSVMKQAPVFSPLTSARYGMGSMPNLSIPPSMPTVFPLASTSSLTSVTTFPPLVMPGTLVPSVSSSSLQNGTSSLLQPLSVPLSSTLPHTGSFSLLPGGYAGTTMQKAQSLIDLGSSSSNSSSTTSLTGNSPKTDSWDWAVPQTSRLKYRQKFNSLDKSMSGYLSGFQVKNALVQSNLSQTQLATIWSLADIDGDGKLKADEFVLAMHLMDMAKAGQPLPLTLPPEFVPPSFRGLKNVDTVNGTLQSYQKMSEEEPPQKKAPVTFEDKRKENYDRGNMELEKRRQVLLEQQQREAERKAQKERDEQERKEREHQEQERKRQLELEKRLEKQRELERQKEEERRKEIERREAAKQELERQRQQEWERIRRQELLNQRNREQEEIVKLKSKKKSLQLELEALDGKHQQISGRLQDVQNRKLIQKNELETIDKKCDLEIMGIKQLQQQLQEYQSKLNHLIPEKQALNERIKQIHLTSDAGIDLVYKKSAEKEGLCQRLRDQLDALEKETAAKLSEMNSFNNQIKDLRESYNKQQSALQQLQKIKQDKLREIERKRAELVQKKKQEEEAMRQAKQEKEIIWKEKVRQEEEEKRKRLHEEKLQEKVQAEKQRAEEEASRQKEREAQQQKLAELKHLEEEEERNRQAEIRQQVERRKRQQEEEKRKQQIKETEERRKQQEEEKKRKDAEKRREAENHVSKISLDEKFVDKMKQIGGKSLMAEWRKEDDPVGASEYKNTAALVNYRALYPFDARNNDELSFNAGDVIQVDENNIGEAGWLYGNFQGNAGWFPSNYVEKMLESAKVLSPKKALLPPTISVPAASPPSKSLSPSKQADAADSDYQNVPFSTLNVNTTWQKTSAFTRTVSPGSNSPIHGQGQAVENLKAQALCSWTAKKDNHLNFSKNDAITVLEQQENWWFGEVHGQKGWFPKSYVKIIPGNENKAVEIDAVYASVNKKSRTTACIQGEEYIALYPYTSSEPGDLTFSQGEVILVTQKNAEWWTGNIDGRRGIFPSNYVKPKDPDSFGNAGRTGTLNKKPEIAQVTSAYTATGVEQLNLAPGQLILIIKKNPSGWWEGELQARGKKRQKGWFPATHVKVLGPGSDKTTTVFSPVCQVIAMYDYTANNEDELSFTKGLLINVINKDDADWWQGEVNGITGLFPSNYVKMTTDTDPSQQ